MIELTDDLIGSKDPLLYDILNELYDMAIIVDCECKIIRITEKGLKQLGKNLEDVSGADVRLFDQLSPFDRVIKNGSAELNIFTIIKNRKSMENIYPIFRKGKVIGALGVISFRNLSVLKNILSETYHASDGQVKNDKIYNAISRIDTSYTFDDFIGKSDVVKRMIEISQKASETMKPVLIMGETGTGKEIIANAIHASSFNKTFAPFVKINCSAIPETLLESELFGHEKGAFTNAMTTKKGKFEIANGGSILLDEIGDMPQILQSKLLRVLEEKEFERVGGLNMIRLNARIIASTNSDLYEKSFVEKTFRSDLYYRLSTIEIIIPPLRKRIDDLPLLIDRFIERDELKISFTKGAVDEMKKYSWPGNVRELRNFMNRLDVIHNSRTINSQAIMNMLGAKQITSNVINLNKDLENRLVTMDDYEKYAIMKTLKKNNNRQDQTADELKIGRTTLYRKIMKFNISLKE